VEIRSVSPKIKGQHSFKFGGEFVSFYNTDQEIIEGNCPSRQFDWLLRW